MAQNYANTFMVRPNQQFDCNILPRSVACHLMTHQTQPLCKKHANSHFFEKSDTPMSSFVNLRSSHTTYYKQEHFI